MTDEEPKEKAPPPRPRQKPDQPWAHKPGCTNPANALGQDDWNCPCGPEVIKG